MHHDKYFSHDVWICRSSWPVISHFWARFKICCDGSSSPRSWSRQSGDILCCPVSLSGSVGSLLGCLRRENSFKLIMQHRPRVALTAAFSFLGELSSYADVMEVIFSRYCHEECSFFLFGCRISELFSLLFPGHI